MQTQKTASRHGADPAITGGTVGCQNDNHSATDDDRAYTMKTARFQRRNNRNNRPLSSWDENLKP